MNCLPNTGLSVVAWVVLGAIAIAAGVGLFVVLRKTGKRGHAALAIALIVTAGGIAAGEATASPAQAAVSSCEPGAAGGGGATNTSASSVNASGSGADTTSPTDTTLPTNPQNTQIATTAPPTPDPIDLAPSVVANPILVPDRTPTPVTYTVTVRSLRSTASTGPVTVAIEKVAPANVGGVSFAGTGWTIDSATDPTHYLATYAPTIAGATSSAPLVVTYPGFTTASLRVNLGTQLLPGSGGDDNATNNFANATVAPIA